MSVEPLDFGDDLGAAPLAPMPTTPLVPEKIDYKAKDMALYMKWRQTGSKKDMSALVDHLSPLIYTEVARASGTLPQAALSAEAKVWAIKGVKSFDPDKGFKLGTHVTNYLQRVRRMNYKYQNAARLPENMQLQFHEYNKSLTQLSDELNREPNEEELAHRLGWSKGQVVKFKKSLYADLGEGISERPTEVSRFSDQAILMKEILADLTPEEKFIWDNKKSMSTAELAAHLGVNNNRYNYLQSKLVKKIENLKKQYGMT
jgi:RNA polymerase sigma factor (sigma-70 family)